MNLSGLTNFKQVKQSEESIKPNHHKIKMNKNNLKKQKNIGLWGVICGSLIVGIPAIPSVAKAQLNPCPGIYYTEPFNTRAIPPEGCPPNEAVQLRGGTQQQVTPGVPGATPAVPPQTQTQTLTCPPPSQAAAQPPGQGMDQPPSPENRSQAIATVMPTDGMVEVQLMNNTNAVITYEVVGQTQRRYLQGGEETVLRGIPTPATITLVRQDEGLLEVKAMAASDQEGLLEVSLDEDQNLDDTQGVLRIQEDGQVFLN